MLRISNHLNPTHPDKQILLEDPNWAFLLGHIDNVK